MTARSSAAIATPPATPQAGSARRGNTAAMTADHASDIPRWTVMAVINSTGVRRSCGNTMTPTARAPSSTSSPRTSAHAVEGSAEHAAPARPAASASRATPLGIRRPTRASLQRARPAHPSRRSTGAVHALPSSPIGAGGSRAGPPASRAGRRVSLCARTGSERCSLGTDGWSRRPREGEALQDGTLPLPNPRFRRSVSRHPDDEESEMRESSNTGKRAMARRT
jgi:hypothetical protein